MIQAILASGLTLRKQTFCFQNVDDELAALLALLDYNTELIAWCNFETGFVHTNTLIRRRGGRLQNGRLPGTSRQID